MRALRLQFSHVLVVDNGSLNQDFVIEVAHLTNCSLICNNENVGVATALNQAIAKVLLTDFEWLATFDQDSMISPSSAFQLFAMYCASEYRDRVGIISMAHLDRALGKGYHGKKNVLAEGDDWRLLRATITSGSYVRMAAILSVGLFDGKLFIDAVDHDFCLRLRRRNWLILEGKNCILIHSIGNATSHRLLGREFACTHHSALRRYYITRNHLEVSVRNLVFDPSWSLKNLFQLMAGNVATLMYEDKKKDKLYAMLEGTAHFLLRRFGPR
jgi:rhamnosyltransferase